MATTRLPLPLLAHERPATSVTPYPWGVIWIRPNGDVEYDDEKTTREYVEAYVAGYREQLRRTNGETF